MGEGVQHEPTIFCPALADPLLHAMVFVALFMRICVMDQQHYDNLNSLS